jgi:hypothetical protein
MDQALLSYWNLTAKIFPPFIPREHFSKRLSESSESTSKTSKSLAKTNASPKHYPTEIGKPACLNLLKPARNPNLILGRFETHLLPKVRSHKI